MKPKTFYYDFTHISEKIKQAMNFALKAHENQKYGADPYSKHLVDVARCRNFSR